jgi:hypothetical protein
MGHIEGGNMKTPSSRDYEAEVLAVMKKMQSCGKAIVLHEAKKALADYPARQAIIYEFPSQKNISSAPVREKPAPLRGRAAALAKRIKVEQDMFARKSD